MFRLAQCRVQSKDRLNDGNTVTLSKDSDIDVGRSLDDLDVSIIDGVDILLYLNSLDIFGRSIFNSFVEFFTVMRINTSLF